MYSVIAFGGFQHKVVPGERVKVSKIEAAVGDVVTVSDVLLFANGDTVKVGTPKVSEALVKLEVLQHDRDDKVIIFKRKRRKRYRLTKGHRQHFTEVLVREISCGPDKKSVDEKTAQRSRVRAQALQRQKIQVKKPTRREKVAAQSTEK
ncbi:MAG TPA: 50S ribosomal protein L21 [Fibrobacteres bacterium]|jgi:ribosomal protein L21|nr:50S ribosomal protein L21 [Fibrobacterota bacterium]